MITGARLRQARDLRGLSRRQLSEQIGFSEKTIQNWEEAETVPASAEPVVRAHFGRDLDPRSDDDVRTWSSLELVSELHAMVSELGRRVTESEKGVDHGRGRSADTSGGRVNPNRAPGRKSSTRGKAGG